MKSASPTDDARLSTPPQPESGDGGGRKRERELHSKAGEGGRRTSNRLAASPSKVPTHQSQSQHHDPKKREEPPMSLDMLYAHLTALFPARGSEIKQLLGLLGKPCDTLFPLFVYGGASTGKTSILLETFRKMKRPFAYTSCRSSYTPRLLFESILNQLLRHARSPANNFASAKKCDKLGDFLGFLADACYSAASAKDAKGATCLNKMSYDEEANSGVSSQPVVYLIFDNVELLLDWPGGFRLISSLLRLSEFSGLANLGLIFASSLGPDSFFSGTGMLEAIPVYMRDYTDDDLHQILLKRKPKGELYSSFLSAVLKPFSRVTRRVTELSEALEPLFQKYIEPIRRGVVKPDEQGKRKLFSLVQPHITSALHQTCSFSASSAHIQSLVQRRSCANNLEPDFQLSLCSKYILVSSFICSRNPATLDATLFDSGGGSSKKRRRKSSQTAIEKKEMERQEKLLKGPGTFPLERLLAIFCCISEDFTDDVEGTDTACLDTNRVGMSPDVLMQVSTLVNANLLYKGASDPLEGAPRYRCNASEELVLTVARSVNFPLSRYLYRM